MILLLMTYDADFVVHSKVSKPTLAAKPASKPKPEAKLASKQDHNGKNQLGAELGADAKRPKVAGGDSDSSKDSSSSSREKSKVLK